jgi:hypothetical protein
MGFSAIFIISSIHSKSANLGIFWHVFVGNFGKIFGKFQVRTKGNSAVGER